jgi:hypothetical protein
LNKFSSIPTKFHPFSSILPTLFNVEKLVRPTLYGDFGVVYIFWKPPGIRDGNRSGGVEMPQAVLLGFAQIAACQALYLSTPLSLAVDASFLCHMAMVRPSHLAMNKTQGKTSVSKVNSSVLVSSVKSFRSSANSRKVSLQLQFFGFFWFCCLYVFIAGFAEVSQIFISFIEIPRVLVLSSIALR